MHRLCPLSSRSNCCLSALQKFCTLCNCLRLLLCSSFGEGQHERMMTVMLKAELEVQRRLQHPLRHRYARFTKVLITISGLKTASLVYTLASKPGRPYSACAPTHIPELHISDDAVH